MIVLHLLRQQIPEIPVLFLDTGYHFAQTYEYRDRIAKEWQLHLVNVLPQQTVAQQESQFGILYQSNPTQCCQLRKVEPLMQSLEPYEIWFTGLRREQSPSRKNLKIAGTASPAERQDASESEPARRLDLEASLELRRRAPASYLPQYDEGYLEHRLPALHRDT